MVSDLLHNLHLYLYYIMLKNLYLYPKHRNCKICIPIVCPRLPWMYYNYLKTLSSFLSIARCITFKATYDIRCICELTWSCPHMSRPMCWRTWTHIEWLLVNIMSLIWSIINLLILSNCKQQRPATNNLNETCQATSYTKVEMDACKVLIIPLK
jgi:hypothetical protein